MALETTVSGPTKVTIDTENPRIYIVEHKCTACGQYAPDEDTVWACTCYGKQPYHTDCLPETD